MAKEFNTRIMLKRDTSANWTSYNPVIKNGEIILVDTDAGELRAKVGDGFSKYTQLPFSDEAIRNLIAAEVAELESVLDGKAEASHGTHVSYSATAPVMDGTASVGSASTVARSDHRHPVDTSRASQTDLDTLESIVSGKSDSGHSHAISDVTNLQTTLDSKTNQNAFSNVVVGSTTIAADNVTDTLTFAAGSNIALTPDSTNDKITISATDTTYSAATTSAAGLMSASDKSKLDAITASADSVSFSRSLSSGTKIGTITINGTGTDLYCETNTDTNTTYSAATASSAGLMSASDKSKLDGITASADSVSFSQSLTSGTQVGTITINGTSTKLYAPTNTDTVYTHPTTSGNKHIPSGGSSGQILRWSADGTAAWGADNNTTYSAATTSAAGLMSASDKSKLDGIAGGANAYSHPTYTARTGKPTANQTPAFGGTATVSQITSDTTGHVTGATDRTITIPSTLSNGTGTAGLIKTTSTVTSNSGYTACPVISGVPYYKDTNTTYSLSSFGITATAAELNALDGITATVTELNCCDGVTSNIQTQLDSLSSEIALNKPILLWENADLSAAFAKQDLSIPGLSAYEGGRFIFEHFYSGSWLASRSDSAVLAQDNDLRRAQLLHTNASNGHIFTLHRVATVDFTNEVISISDCSYGYESSSTSTSNSYCIPTRIWVIIDS